MYDLLIVSNDGMFIFIVFGISNSPANIILKFFPFHYYLMKSTIERRFPINLAMVYTMKWVVILTIGMYFHITMFNNKKQSFLIFH